MTGAVRDRGVERRSDDRDAFGALLEQALPRIYGYFFHRCGGAIATAEELTQETVLAATAAVRAGKGDAVEAPLPWLFGIARHKLLDHYRREARTAGVALVSWEAWGEEEGEAAADPDPDLGDAPWEEAGWRERTQRALAALPPTQRQALTLRHLDELSVPEIAVALGRSVHAVESLLARGRAGFKRAYAEASDG